MLFSLWPFCNTGLFRPTAVCGGAQRQFGYWEGQGCLYAVNNGHCWDLWTSLHRMGLELGADQEDLCTSWMRVTDVSGAGVVYCGKWLLGTGGVLCALWLLTWEHCIHAHPMLAEDDVVGIQRMPLAVGVYVCIQSFAGLAGPPLGGKKN